MLWYLVFEFPIINGTVKCKGRGLKTALHLLGSSLSLQVDRCIDILEIVFTRAAPAFDNLFMGCVFNINTVHKTVEKLTFQAFY